MSNHLSSEELALYVDAMRLDRAPELPGRIQLHVSRCEQCKEEVLELLELTDTLPYNTEEPHPYFDRVITPPSRAWVTAWRVAAALAVVIGLGAIGYLLDPLGEKRLEPRAVSFIEDSARSADEAPLATREPAVSPASPDGGDMAARFVESPNLEDLVGMPLRSGPSAMGSPPAGAVLEGPIEFTWRTTAPGPFRVSVLDNTDHVVFDTALAASRMILHQRLGPGLYYWKVVAGGRLQLVSKFLVDGHRTATGRGS